MGVRVEGRRTDGTKEAADAPYRQNRCQGEPQAPMNLRIEHFTPPRVPLWRREMFNSQVHRSLWLALAAVLTVRRVGGFLRTVGPTTLYPHAHLLTQRTCPDEHSY